LQIIQLLHLDVQVDVEMNELNSEEEILNEETKSDTDNDIEAILFEERRLIVQQQQITTLSNQLGLNGVMKIVNNKKNSDVEIFEQLIEWIENQKNLNENSNQFIQLAANSLYANSIISILDAYILIEKYCIKNKLTTTAKKDLLDLINCFLPEEESLKTSIYKLEKLFACQLNQ
jgi:hypothetical protein